MVEEAKEAGGCGIGSRGTVVEMDVGLVVEGGGRW